MNSLNLKSLLRLTVSYLFSFWVVLLVTACNSGPNYSNTGGINIQEVTYTQVRNNILVPKCISCHSDIVANGGVSYSSYSSLMASPGSVVPYQPYNSQIYKKTVSGEMPQGATHLSNAELQQIYNWIALGAKGN